jgi:hypothetical protein
MKQSNLYISLFLLIFSCDTNSKKQSTVTNQKWSVSDSFPIVIRNDLKQQINDTILLKKEKIYFSSNESKDEFLIYLIGKNIIDSKLYINITNSKGDELLNLNYEAIQLINPTHRERVLNSLERDSVIKYEFFNLLTEKSFHSPAINQEEIYEQPFLYEVIDSIEWEKIKKDTNSIGFCITLENGGECYVYDKINKVVICYFSCC